MYDKKEGIVNNLINKINAKEIINYLLIYKYDLLIEIVINKIYKTSFYFNFYKYYLKNNIDYLIYLKLLKVNIEEIEEQYLTYFNEVLNISKENVSFDLFKLIVNKDTNYNKDILNNLFTKCDKLTQLFNKNKLSITFKKILYYTYKFIKKVNLKELNINSKIKYTYYIIYEIIKNINNLTFMKSYKKIYENKVYINIFTNIFCSSNILEINETIIKKLINIFNINYISNEICKNINYFHINNQIEYYNYIFNELDKQILFYNLIDCKVQELIQKPYTIFNNINERVSILMWLNVTKNQINLMYYQPIKISNEDIINLSEILYLLGKVKEQKINCTNYRNFIYIANKFKKLIIFNDRINLKINDIFINKNINLGHLVKNIKNNNNINFNENLNVSDDLSLKYKIKYLKYKGKYLCNLK